MCLRSFSEPYFTPPAAVHQKLSSHHQVRKFSQGFHLVALPHTKYRITTSQVFFRLLYHTSLQAHKITVITVTPLNNLVCSLCCYFCMKQNTSMVIASNAIAFTTNIIKKAVSEVETGENTQRLW